MKKDDSSSRLSLFDHLFSYLSARKPSDRLLVYFFALGVIVSGAYALLSFNSQHLVAIPEQGGLLNEGVVGTPRFVNPVLAITRTDHDLVSLLYSGLMKLGADGKLENDLAESITISADGRTYNVVLRDDATWHDGQPVTAYDVAYTIGLIQNAELKSPLRGNWTGVEVEVINDHELNIVLEDAYTPFMENLTVGILPKHVWGGLSIEELPFSQNNTEPIGSGPYQLTSVHRTKSGLIDSYYLRAASEYNAAPNITELQITFFANEDALVDALKKGLITSTAYLSNNQLSKVDTTKYQIISDPLPRVFSIFLNQNKSTVLRDAAVRDALGEVVDREDLVNTVLDGHGLPTDSPIPSGYLDVVSSSTATSTTVTDRIASAEEILKNGGWTKTDDGHWQKNIDDEITTLSLTLATANTDVFAATADYLKKVWSDLGVEVTVAKFEQADLVQTVIRPRNFEALLFGIDVGRPLDLYPFWHSSQREDPGLNISSYANITSDDLLEKIRTSTDTSERTEQLTTLIHEIETDHPAIFLYTPTFSYVVDHDVMLVPVTHLADPSERFSTIRDWYMNQDNVWPIFRAY